MLKAIIFDMDGVLVNSVGSIWKSFLRVFEQYGVDTEEFKRLNKEKYEGRSLKQQLQMWKEDLHMEQEFDANTFSKEAFKYQLEIAKDDYIPNPSVLQLIQEAKSQ
jgi:beta-phosphoglucomutase-like phosphatase (HAD superfamily)